MDMVIISMLKSHNHNNLNLSSIWPFFNVCYDSPVFPGYSVSNVWQEAQRGQLGFQKMPRTCPFCKPDGPTTPWPQCCSPRKNGQMTFSTYRGTQADWFMAKHEGKLATERWKFLHSMPGTLLKYGEMPTATATYGKKKKRPQGVNDGAVIDVGRRDVVVCNCTKHHLWLVVYLPL